MLAILLAWCGLAAVWGTQVRTWVWPASEPVRFHGDIGNGMNWGSRVLRLAHEQADRPWEESATLTFPEYFAGYRGLYDNLAAARADAERANAAADAAHQIVPNDHLDYAPLRLLVMSGWMWHVRALDPSVEGSGQYRDEFVEPMLQVNLVVEAASALLMLGFVADWCMRCGRSPAWSAVGGVVAGTLVWFSPAIVLDAHAWPQWDVWAVPFYIAAVWAASRNMAWLWFVAGVVIGVGSMLKGQLLMASAMLPIWAIVAGGLRGWKNAPALLGGFVGAWAIITSIWLLDHRGPQIATLVLLLLIGALLAAVPKVRRSDRLLAFACAVGLVVFAAGYLFDGSFAWLTYGFARPTEQYPKLMMGPTSNLAALLNMQFGFHLRDAIAVPVWGGAPLRSVLIAAFAVCVVFAGIMAGIQQRRRSTTLLIVVALPWLAMFTLAPQMHERYLLWAAAISAAGAAASLGGFVSHLGITALATTMIGNQLLDQNPAFAPTWLDFCRNTQPGVGWAVIAVLVAYLVMACSAGRKRGAGPRGD